MGKVYSDVEYLLGELFLAQTAEWMWIWYQNSAGGFLFPGLPALSTYFMGLRTLLWILPLMPFHSQKSFDDRLQQRKNKHLNRTQKCCSNLQLWEVGVGVGNRPDGGRVEKLGEALKHFQVKLGFFVDRFKMSVACVGISIVWTLC